MRRAASGGLVGFAGRCWRAVPAGHEAHVLDGTVRVGRYNRPAERTLYLSGSPAGVAAAMTRYGDATRTMVPLQVVAARLVDLRDADACARLGIDVARVGEDWMAALDRGDVPASWTAADRVRAIAADGVIDGSRRLPGAWHLVLFRWNVAGGPYVSIVDQGPIRAG